MTKELLYKLEGRIDNTVETIELLKMQIEELENKYTSAMNENMELKKKQASWEENLTMMLEKLEAIEPKEQESIIQESTQVENNVVNSEKEVA